MSSQLSAILVTDLVGSTEIRARIGEERADALRREHDRVLGDAIRAAGGEVVKGLGDGVLARFAGAADAVGAAVAIQRAAAVHSPQGDDAPLHVRIGVAVGDISLEEGDVFGTPVIEASRLCALADGGQILVVDLVRALSHGRGEHEFTPLGARELKGLPHPVEVCEVGWAPVAAVSASFPLPSALAGGDRFGFAGRSEARELLAERWKAACVEERQIVLIAGEPGIGKTRLASELARDAADDGAAVFLGRCFEDIDVPYAPFGEALVQLVRNAPVEVLADHVDEAGGDLVRIVPDLARRVDVPPLPKADGELERLRLFDAVVDVLARVGEVAPVLLVLDDLHWADPSTVELLLWLARTSRPMRLAVVGTYRDTDVARTHSFGGALAELRRTRAVERVALSGLDEQEVESFLERAGGQALEREGLEFAALLRAETEGNPFFLQELLLHFVETGALRRDGTRWVGTTVIGELGVPEGVRDVVGRRLSLLGDEVNEILRAASVLGQEFELGVLGALAEREPDDLLDVLEVPCTRGLLQECGVDRYRFAHALIRQTLYEELAAGRRARFHRRAADALEAGGAAAAEVAHHLIAAGPRGDAERAIELAREAAVRAEETLAWEQAVGWYRRALDQAELADIADATRAALLCALGGALNLCGEMAEARRPLAEAVALAAGARAIETAAAAAIGYAGSAGPWLEYGDQDGVRLLEQVATLVPDDALALRSRIGARLAFWHVLDSDSTEPVKLSEAAVELARASGDPRALAEAVHTFLVVGGGTINSATSLALADELAAAADACGDDSLAAWAGVDRSIARLRAGAVRDGARHLLDLHARATRAGYTNLIQMVEWHLNAVEFLAGRLDRARRHVDFAFGRTLSAGEELVAFGQRLLAADVADDDDAMEAIWLETAAAHNPIVHIFPWEAALAANRGEGVRAAELLRRWRDVGRPFCPGFMRSYTDTYAVTTLRRTDDAELAAWLYDQLLVRSGEWAYGAAPFGSVDIWLGAAARVAGRYDDARRHLDAAWGAHTTEGARLWIPVIDCEMARVLIAEGDGAGARDRLETAREMAAEMGASRFERESERLLSSLSVAT